MEPFPSIDVLGVLDNFGISEARRGEQLDQTEEVILVPAEQLQSVDGEEVALALMRVIPHTKVWVIPDEPPWTGVAL